MLLLLAAPSAFAGEACLRLTVDAPGVYDVPAQAVKDAGLDLAKCDLFAARETAVPIVEKKDGSFEFWGDPGERRNSRERSYILRPRAAGAAPARADAVALPDTTLIEKNDYYDPLECTDRTLLGPFGESADYFFFGKPESSQQYPLEIPWALAGDSKTVDVTFRLQGARRGAASNGLEIEWNGTKVGALIRWSGGKAREEKVAIDRALLTPKSTVRLSARDGKIRLDSIRIAAGPKDAPAARRPLRVEVAKPEDLTAGGAEWVAITLDSLAEEIAPLVEHRTKRGLKTRVVRLQDVFDGFSGGTFDPAAVRDFLKLAAEKWDPKPRYVLLCGDATYDVDWFRPRGETMPTALVDTYDNGASASDDWFVAWGDDRAIPSLAIGRFPAQTKEQCRTMVERTIRYETSSEEGPWRRKLSFVAGEGRFGEVVDRMIEELATRIFNEYVPYGFDLNMTYASASSPYLYVPAKLTDKVIERMNEGCALLSYTGHGHRAGFDVLQYKGKRWPIFAAKDIARVKCGAHAPIVFITACWTGCFDYPDEEPVGETLFEHPTGPVAVFAASRVSHPFANAMLSKELVAALFGKETLGKPLGDGLQRAKRFLVEGKDEYRDTINTSGMMVIQDPLLLQRLLSENMHLYNLLGDPGLTPVFPAREVSIECGTAMPGKKLKVKGTVDAPKDGKAVVTFEIARAKIRGKIEPVEIEAKDAEKKITKNYDTANDKVVTKVETALKGGAFEVELAIPEDLLPFKYYVKAFVWSDTQDASGACEVKLEAEE